jgi:hypothetical protein
MRVCRKISTACRAWSTGCHFVTIVSLQDIQSGRERLSSQRHALASAPRSRAQGFGAGAKEAGEFFFGYIAPALAGELEPLGGTLTRAAATRRRAILEVIGRELGRYVLTFVEQAKDEIVLSPPLAFAYLFKVF